MITSYTKDVNGADICQGMQCKNYLRPCHPESPLFSQAYTKQSFENIMDGKDYQRGSIEKDGNRQRNSETINTRKLQYLGHLIRHNSPQLHLIEGKIEGRRSRGRPINTWTTDITTTKGMNYYQLKRAAEDRKSWHGLVVNLAQEKTLR